MDDLKIHEELEDILRRRIARLRWYEWRKRDRLYNLMMGHDIAAAYIRKRRRFPNSY